MDRDCKGCGATGETEAVRQGAANACASQGGAEAIQEGQGRWRCWICGYEFGGCGEDGGENGWKEAVSLNMEKRSRLGHYHRVNSITSKDSCIAKALGNGLGLMHLYHHIGR